MFIWLVVETTISTAGLVMYAWYERRESLTEKERLRLEKLRTKKYIAHEVAKAMKLHHEREARAKRNRGKRQEK